MKIILFFSNLSLSYYLLYSYTSISATQLFSDSRWWLGYDVVGRVYVYIVQLRILLLSLLHQHVNFPSDDVILISFLVIQLHLLHPCIALLNIVIVYKGWKLIKYNFCGLNHMILVMYSSYSKPCQCFSAYSTTRLHQHSIHMTRATIGSPTNNRETSQSHPQ